MKHLIIFLNYCQSRIQNPVYRQFATTSLVSRNATLLYLSKPLEERELLHEVNELRRKEETPSDITFHICATLDHVDIGRLVAQTIALIRKNYASGPDHAYHIFSYCQLPDLLHCSDAERNAAWKSLVSINNAVTDYLDIQFLQSCFLYTESTQNTLAEFLYNVTQYEDVRKALVQPHQPASSETDFPPCFATFDATGISYPDDEIRYYLHQTFLHALLSISQAENNPVAMETCNSHAEQILGLVPLGNAALCLQEASFINLNPDSEGSWDVSSEYWNQVIELACQGISDLPREEWFSQMRNRVEVLYQSRFRDVGVEFFFNLELKKTADYCRILLASIQQALMQVMLQLPYPPSALKDIVHAIVNRLQQKVLEIGQNQQQALQQANEIQQKLNGLNDSWNSLSLFDRLRGKHNLLLAEYKRLLQSLYELRTLIPGCTFATKLLNELIPQVASLSDGSDRMTAHCLEALKTTERNAVESEPATLGHTFPIEPIHQAAQAISLDQEHLFEYYSQLSDCLYGKNPVLDGEDLLLRLRNKLTDQIDLYLNRRIQDGTLPAVLDVTIVDRIAGLYEGQGGVQHFVDELKQKTALSLLMKEKSGFNDHYLLIAPPSEALGDHVVSRDHSHIKMLHYCTGISLQDLDGFSGKRMFVEPSIF